MAKKIRLFKIASEINIGKDTIVNYLSTKGFDIENKPTSVLTEEMLDAIYDKFKNEKRAAEKQREKLEKHKQLRKSAVEKSVGEKEETKVAVEKEIPSGKTVVDDQILSDYQQAEPALPVDLETPEPTIQEDDGKVTQPEQKVAEEKLPEATEKKTVPPVTEETQPEAKIPEETIDEHREKEQEVEVPEKTPKEIKKEDTSEIDTKKVPKEEKKVVSKTQTKATKASEDESARRKKRRRVAEVEYGDEEQPKLKGLKIVGKISIDKKEPPQKKRIKPTVIEDDEAAAAKAKKSKRKKAKPTVPEDVPKAKSNKRRKRRKSIREMISPEDVDMAIKKTMAGMSEGSTASKRSKMRHKRRVEKEQKRIDDTSGDREILTLTEFVTTSDIANMMDITPNEIIVKCLEMGLMVSINQRLDKDTIEVIADDYGYDVEFVDEKTMEDVEDDVDLDEDLKPRPPIVTIMGHVDHGKTSLLDQIRESNVVAGEAGGITQHIGAYRVELTGHKYITFIDTPGHEAFTAMRARGAHVTDIVVLVVAADDSVMPQTEEAISHAQAAGVPIVVAINKIDKPDSQPDRIKQQLSEHGILVEDWGGKNQSVEISAKKGTNIGLLLEKILLEAEMLDLKANPDRLARATVVEANMDRGLGPVATIIVQKGTMKEHQPFVAGLHSGRVRAMFDERNNKVDTAAPSMPVRVTGFEGLPEAGDTLIIVSSEQEAKETATSRQQLRREQEFRKIKQVTLDDISKQIKEGQTKDLNLIIKTDVSGSAEALSDSLLKLSQNEVRVNILHKGVGAITESDVMLAVASGGVIIGFQANPSAQARKLADQETVEIRLYNIIYDCINDVKLALEGMLSPELREDVTSTVEVRKVFKISKVGVIAGCYITNGKITRNDRVRLLRDGLPVFTGGIDSLKRNKDDVKEVEQGFECGISLDGFNNIEVGDIIEGFQIIEIRRKFNDKR